MLYIVATPIGNLEDITLRALRILREVDLVAAEDTRQTRKLLARYDIETELTSYHEHNERTKAVQLVDRLESGESIALVSDAGTPTISDPGYHLVREAVARGIRVSPIPGASALTAALSVAGLPTGRFAFEGFLPSRRSQRLEALAGHKSERRTLIYYESPHRLAETLKDIHEVLGDRPMAVARELTKIHEEFTRGLVSEVRAQLSSTMRGECVLVVAGSSPPGAFDEQELEAEIRSLQESGLKASAIAKALAQMHDIPKREVYRKVLAEKTRRSEREDS